MYNVVFHNWIYVDDDVEYYEGGLTYPDQIHFVMAVGGMNNRHEDLLQLAIL